MAGSDVTAWPDRLIPVSILFAPHHCSRIRCIVAHDPSLLFGDLIETLVRSSQLLLQCCCLLWQISTVYLTRKTDLNVQAEGSTTRKVKQERLIRVARMENVEVLDHIRVTCLC